MARLHLLACQNHARDLRAVLEADGLEDVSLVVFPSRCGNQPPGWDLLESLVGRDFEDGDQVRVVGGSCTLELADPPPSMAHCRVRRDPRQCQHWYASPDLLGARVRDGAYLITPGWLAGWRDRLRELGLDQTTARALFAESTKSLLLLDTGTDPKSEQRLADMSAHIDRPHDTLPVGLSFLRLFLTEIVLEWRSEANEALAREANRRAADYSMVLDTLRRLAIEHVEDKVVDGLIELFGGLLAPGRMHYLTTEEGRPGKVRAHPPGASDLAAARERLLEAEDDVAWDPTLGALSVRFCRGEETFGVLRVEELACPEYGPAYCELLRTIRGACGLALANARSYQRLAQAHEQTQRHANELERSNAELEQFASVASHDLREPLRMVSSYALLLAERYEGQLDETADRYIGYAVDGAARMGRLIDDLLALSRVGARTKRPVPTDCAELVADVVDGLQKAIEESGAELVVGDLPTVIADRTQLGQVFQNLIANALEFRGEAPPTVEITAEREGARWAISVADNGLGIDPQFHDRIFSAFHRLHTREDFEGNGIGLSIVQKVVEAHGGRVRIESALGEGARFVFTMAAADGPADSKVEPI